MQIILYGKPGCGLCSAAEKKLEILGLGYSKRNLFSVEQWREDADGYASAMAAHAMSDTLPIISVGGRCMTYPEAMAFLRRTRDGGDRSDVSSI